MLSVTVNSYADLVPGIRATTALFPSSQGVHVAVHDWGGDGPPLVFIHATGLHAHVYLPMVQRLRSEFRCIGIDLRGQGFTNPPDDGNFSWRGVRDDTVAALDGLGLSGRGDIRGISHSQGGYAMMAAAIERPGTFSHIVGMEPVAYGLPPGAKHWDRIPNPMSEGAQRRRRTFPSSQAAFDNFVAKLPFMLADRDVVACYVHFGFVEEDDGSVTLRCRPEHEAELFMQGYSDLLDHLHRLDADTTLLLSEHTNDMFKVAVPEQSRRIPRSRLIHLPGRSHFGMLEGVEEMTAICRAHLGLEI